MNDIRGGSRKLSNSVLKTLFAGKRFQNTRKTSPPNCVKLRNMKNKNTNRNFCKFDSV